MLKITSRDNPRLKHAGRVREGLIKDSIFVEGIRLAEEISRSNLQIYDVFFSESFINSARGQQFLLQHNSASLVQVSDKIFGSLSDTKNAQGIVVICEKPFADRSSVESSLFAPKKLPLAVLLHNINNPANLGAILRSCEAVNVGGVIVTKNSADVFSPKALRGAMGASLRLPMWTEADFYEVLDWAKKKNLISLCADVNAEKSYLDFDWKKPHLLIFGSEAHGLNADERAKIDESLLIPMDNAVESLNLAVSCAVILFEAKRQLHATGQPHLY